MDHPTTTDEQELLAAFRACEPDDRERLLAHARTYASLAGRPRRSLDELVAEASRDPARRRVLDDRVARARAAGLPVYRIVRA